MSVSESYFNSLMNYVGSTTTTRSPHHKKDVILRFVRLSAFTILAVIVLFLIYRVRILYHQYLKYQRLERDETEVSIQGNNTLKLKLNFK